MSFRYTLTVVTVLAASVISSPASANLKDVCASGCTYSTLQAAVDSITDSGPDNVYTIHLEAGVLNSSTSTALNGKSYINIVGRGMGTSILRATSTWFANVNSGAEQHPSFLDLVGSTNIRIANLSIDARTNATNGIAHNPAGIGTDNADRIVIDGCSVDGDVYAVWEITNTSDHLIEILGSKIRGIESGVRIGSAVWHIYGSEISAINNGEGSGTFSAIGLQIHATSGGSTVIWGSHIHGQSSWPSAVSVQAVYASLAGGAEFVAVGSTLHAKLLAESTTNLAYVSAFQMAFGATNDGNVEIVGSQLIYETPEGLTQGHVGGILVGRTAATAEINLAGGSIADMGGSGGVNRADVIRQVTTGPACQSQPYCLPKFRAVGTRIASVRGINGAPTAGLASGFDTLNERRGFMMFTGNPDSTVPVAFPEPLPDTNYRVAISSNAAQTIWVTDKSPAGFKLHSSTPSSTATVEWIVSR